MTYILVDVQHLIHRVKNSVSGDPDMKAGMALHILFNSILKVWTEAEGTHVVFCLDHRSWRRDFFSSYKAHRRVEVPRTPQEVEEAEHFQEVIDDLLTFIEKRTNCSILRSYGVEADDWIARWIHNHPDDTHCILSSDSDFLQLLSDNVFIYDGVKELIIKKNEVLNNRGKAQPFKIVGGRVKITKDAEITAPADDWPEWCLFFKCIRGDAADGIHSAYPGVREKGSMKKPGLLEAFADRKDQGYAWNNVMLSEWDKVTDIDKDGNTLKEKVRVKEEYEFNKKLIDLTQQPDDIKELMDKHIIEQVQKPRKGQVGMFFLRFCEQYQLNNLSRYPTKYASYLNAAYRK